MDPSARQRGSYVRYTRNSLVLSATDRRGKTTEYEYDTLNRRTLVRDARNQTAETTYVLASRLAS